MKELHRKYCLVYLPDEALICQITAVSLDNAILVCDEWAYLPG